MSGINKVILIGRLGRDPEVRAFEGGLKRASFSLATSEVYKNKEGNKVEHTEWHNIVCWRFLAEIAEKYLTKGKQIYLEGRLRTRSWEDNGIKKYTTEIEATTFTMLGTKDDGVKPTAEKVIQAPQAEVGPATTDEDFVTDDLPF
ncbi:MAG: single-stranded DNA-binding protein [Bacteroidales bacterium]|mgnify:FL=1|jgi:single-strand DNA-binding protein|nr:single-stranded DNA-binding protein [Bacteroidales bacterium]HHT51701.1 single-stranded DNA-binding protein [Bacteroidales bacterium]